MTPVVPKVKQPHGGALQVGNPGNRGNPNGGPGRPRSAIRDSLAGTFDEAARPFLESVVRGDIVSKIRITVREVGHYLKCPNCGAGDESLVPSDPAFADVEVSVDASATVTQRVQAADLMARYGVGQMKELSADNVRERLGKTLDTLQGILSPEQYERACKEIEPHWA